MASRFNLVLSDEMDRKLDELCGGVETKTTMIRKALAMYVAAVEANRQEGLTVGFCDPNTSELKREVIGL